MKSVIQKYLFIATKMKAKYACMTKDNFDKQNMSDYIYIYLKASGRGSASIPYASSSK